MRIMETLSYLLQNFFTHKDFLPPAAQLAGTLFTPLHLVVSLLWALVVAGACRIVGRKPEKTIRRVYGVIWAVVVVVEIIMFFWDTCAGSEVGVEWTGALPLYPCSIFLYAMPFAVWGKGNVRRAACGYVCSLGLLGGAINFVYPANVLGRYSCISFAGGYTLFYHGVLVFCAVTMLLSGYHRYRGITRARELLLPAVPCLLLSVVANGVNFSPVDSDYMFFKLESFFLAPLGRMTPDWFSVIFVYGVYLLIHALPYLPSYVTHWRRSRCKTRP